MLCITLFDKLRQDPFVMQKATPYILLADDDPDDQDMFIEAFTRRYSSVPISSVNDGQELVSFLDASSTLPILMLIDYKMPVMGGPEVLAYLAQNKAYYSPALKLVWSTSDRPNEKEICLQLGAANYFEKPATSRDVDNLVEQIYQIFITQLTNLGAQQTLATRHQC